MTADVDPLKCLDSRAFNNTSLCGEPDSAHCPGCELCPGHCACPQLANHLPKGTRVRVTFDAIVLDPPTIRPDKWALVVLPDTDLDHLTLLTERFRVPLDALTPLDPEENDRG